MKKKTDVFRDIRIGLEGLKNKLHRSVKHQNLSTPRILDEHLSNWLSEIQYLKSLLSPFIELEPECFVPMFEHLIVVFNAQSLLIMNAIKSQLDVNIENDLNEIEKLVNIGQLTLYDCLKNYKEIRIIRCDAIIESRNLAYLNIIRPNMEFTEARILQTHDNLGKNSNRRIMSLFEQLKLMQSEIASQSRTKYLIAQIYDATPSELAKLINKWTQRVESATNGTQRSEAMHFLRICNERLKDN